MKPILAIAAAASLALLAACERPATVETEAASFSQLDTDGNGSISQSEAQAMPQLEQNFQQTDRNQDGSVDQSEFAQFEAGGAPAEQPPSGQSSSGAESTQPSGDQPGPGTQSTPPAGEQATPSGTQ